VTPGWCEAAIATCGDGFVVLDADGRIVEVNGSFVRQSGYAQDDLIGMSFWELEVDGTEERTRELLAVVAARGPEVRDARQRTSAGATWHVEYALSHHPEGDGRWFVFCREVDRRRWTEGLLVARELISRVAVEGRLDDVLQATLDAAETITGSTIGFLHFVEPNQRDLTLQCWSTNTLRHMCTAEGKGAHYPIDEAGVWVECVRTRRPVIHNDYESLPNKKGLPAGHAPVLRELVLPVLRGDHVAAILGVGNKPTPYHEGDVDMVATLASLCIDLVAAKRVEEDLRRSEARFRSLCDALSQGIDSNNGYPAHVLLGVIREALAHGR